MDECKPLVRGGGGGRWRGNDYNDYNDWNDYGTAVQVDPI